MTDIQEIARVIAEAHAKVDMAMARGERITADEPVGYLTGCDLVSDDLRTYGEAHGVDVTPILEDRSEMAILHRAIAAAYRVAVGQ
jgi:hypothetical protein